MSLDAIVLEQAASALWQAQVLQQRAEPNCDWEELPEQAQDDLRMQAAAVINAMAAVLMNATDAAPQE